MSVKNFFKLLGVLFIFLGGMVAGMSFGPISFDKNIPTGHTIKEKATEVVDTLNPLSLNSAPERPSPGDWIKQNEIEVYSNRVIIHLKNPEWASFTNTNSMDPVIDEHANAIQIIPETPDQIQVGDIVSYESEYADGTIIHRVIYKGEDEEGTYFIMKGDNNPTSDPGKVRFHQMKRVLVAIIY